MRDVVRVLAKTKEDAEKKREELRDLVGRRYHDLIDSADAIISMNDTVVGFEKLLVTIESAAGSLINEIPSQTVREAEVMKKSTSSAVKRKQDDSNAETRSTNDEDDDERNQIRIILKAPTEIWIALEQGEELKAAKALRAAEAVAGRLKLSTNNVGSSSSSSSARRSQSDAFRKACEELDLRGTALTACIQLAEAADDDRRVSSEWQLKFPFLVSQAKLLGECRADIVSTCSSAFAERQISATRVERAVEALMVLGEISNPFTALLQARLRALQALTMGEEDSLFAIAELASRTCRDCAWMKTRFQHVSASEELNTWIDMVAAPVAKSFADSVSSRTTSLAALASLQRSLKDSIKKIDASPDHPDANTSSLINDDELFRRLFALPFQDRATTLLMVAYDVSLRKVKRILTACGSLSDFKRNDYALKAFSILEHGLASVDRDAFELQQSLAGSNGKAHSQQSVSKTPSKTKVSLSSLASTRQWLSDLAAWLETRPTPVNGRFAELLLGLVRDAQDPQNSGIEARLERISSQSVQLFAESLVKRLGEEFEAKAAQLPWSKEGRSASSAAVGGWTADPVHGELPTVASWPAAELCFAVGRELDGFTDALHRGGQICADSDTKARRIVGDAMWKKVHAVYSALAKEASGADGKLQAAFDLEYCAAALLEGSRAPLPFTQGGVDVYACADALRTRARSFAASSKLLHSSWAMSGAKAAGGGQETTIVHETKVGGHNLLTLVEPVPRFALLPMPQKRTATTPRLLHRSSSQASSELPSGAGEDERSAPATKQTSTTGGGLGRVLGWLS